MDVGVREPINSDIQYSMEFLGWEAAVSAGASLDELVKWANGDYPPAFMAKVIARYILHGAVEMHTNEAANPPNK